MMSFFDDALNQSINELSNIRYCDQLFSFQIHKTGIGFTLKVTKKNSDKNLIVCK